MFPLTPERRVSRKAGFFEEADGNRFTRNRSADYNEWSDARTLADIQHVASQAEADWANK